MLVIEIDDLKVLLLFHINRHFKDNVTSAIDLMTLKITHTHTID